MRKLLVTLVVVLWIVFPTSETVAQTKPAARKPVVLHRFALNPLHVNIGTVSSVKPDGRVEVKDIANPRFLLNRKAAGKTDLTEGRYLGFVGKDFVESTKDLRLVAVRVVEVKAGNTAVVQLSAAAAKQIKPGEDLLFFRPPGSTTAALKSAPGFVRVDDGVETAVLGGPSKNVFGSLTTSKNNLHNIVIALHNFHDTYRCFPPAVVYGPDGKPWHSWRVLILPFIEQNALYQRYRFDEPWNGPNNRKLLKEMPKLYRDPIYRQQDGNYYTHYAVATGTETIFPSAGIRMKKKSDKPLSMLTGKGVTRFRDITDGTSNTIILGPVGPEHKIPWMKPEDVAFTPTFPPLGKKGSFAAPYRSGASPFGPFAFADGRVASLRADLDVKTLRNLLQRNDGNTVPSFDARDRPRGMQGPRRMQAVEILRTGGKITARLASDAKDD
jgi:Protein of unknown function (DUF1559)